MSRINDVGGMFGFGEVDWDPDAPTFAAEWEAQVFALTGSLARAGVFNVDEFRHAMERMPPGSYYATTYYGRWLTAIEMLLTEKGLIEDGVLDVAETEA